MTGVDVAGGTYRVGTVVEFGTDVDHPRSGQVCVLTGMGDEPSFTAVSGPGGPTPRSPDLSTVRSAAASGLADLYEVRPRYPPVGPAILPGDADGWGASEAAEPLPSPDADPDVQTDGGGERASAGSAGGSRFPDGFALAFRLAGYSAAFDRRPEGAIRRVDVPGDVAFEDALYSARSLREKFGDGLDPEAVGSAVERAEAFASSTTEDCPRVAVPARPDERGEFASVPFVSPRAVGGADLRTDGALPEGSGPSPLLVQALRQAWHSPRYGVSLAEANYRSGSLTVSVARE
jgi:hypothetical protein